MSKLDDVVLVVEDDATLREALLDTLRAAGLAALAAADAQAALQLLSSEDIGLVISDVHMPGADGYELSDRWEESKMLKDMVRALWDRIAAEAAF